MFNTSTLNTFSKMYSYTEGTVPKVRRELLRLGCKHDEIDVMQQMSCLRLVCENQELIANPFEILATLKSIRRPAKVKDVWAILCISHHEKLRRSNQRIKSILTASLILLVFLLIYLVPIP